MIVSIASGRQRLDAPFRRDVHAPHLVQVRPVELDELRVRFRLVHVVREPAGQDAARVVGRPPLLLHLYIPEHRGGASLWTGCGAKPGRSYCDQRCVGRQAVGSAGAARRCVLPVPLLCHSRATCVCLTSWMCAPENWQWFWTRSGFCVESGGVAVQRLGLLGVGLGSGWLSCPRHALLTILMVRISSTLNGLFESDAKRFVV